MNQLENYIDKGGFIFILLLVMSAIGLTIIIYKFLELYFFNKNYVKNLNFSLEESKSLSEFNENLKNSSVPKLLLVNINLGDFGHGC